jgi:hypothetical protein
LPRQIILNSKKSISHHFIICVEGKEKDIGHMQVLPKDDTLRLLYQEQEADFITEKISYHKRSLQFCVIGMAGIPVFYFLNAFFVGSGNFLLLLGSLLWAILGVFASFSLIPIHLNIKKYKKLRDEHHSFLEKYNRH